MRSSVLLFLAVAACGEIASNAPDAAVDADDADDANTDLCAQTSLSVDDFFVCVSRAVCNFYEDCVASDTAHLDCTAIPINVFGGLEATAAKTVIADAVAAGRTQWNPTAAKACVDLITNGTCALFKNDGDVFNSCTALLGAVNNGQPCQNDIECATPGAQCRQLSETPGNQCTDYVCQAPSPAGGSCASNSFCLPGDHCVYRVSASADVSTCGSGAANQACDDDEDCDRGLFCNGGLDNGTAAGVCTAAKAAGSTCFTDEECASELACVGNFGNASGICRDVRQAGALCDTNNLLSSCYGHQTCESTSANVIGQCNPASDLGGTCNTYNGQPTWCGLFMSCEQGTCHAPGIVGETCTNVNVFGGISTNPDGCNLGLFCDAELTGTSTGLCRAAQSNGSPCNDGDQCAGETCTAMVCTEYPTCDF